MRKLIVSLALLTASPWADAQTRPEAEMCSNGRRTPDAEPFRTTTADNGVPLIVTAGWKHVRAILREWAKHDPDLRYVIEDESTAMQCWNGIFRFDGIDGFFEVLRSEGVEIEERGGVVFLRRAAE